MSRRYPKGSDRAVYATPGEQRRHAEAQALYVAFQKARRSGDVSFVWNERCPQGACAVVGEASLRGQTLQFARRLKVSADLADEFNTGRVVQGHAWPKGEAPCPGPVVGCTHAVVMADAVDWDNGMIDWTSLVPSDDHNMTP